jgi:choline-glycine betaine transporter
MSDKDTQNGMQGADLNTALKAWVMVALTLAFVLLYAGALLGWIQPLENERVVGRLEPIIFVIIGYYFGRLPSQQNEKTLKDEIGRQTQRADAVQHAKEQVQQTRDTLEEKVKNARTALTGAAPVVPSKFSPQELEKAVAPNRDETLHVTVATAIDILSS